MDLVAVLLVTVPPMAVGIGMLFAYPRTRRVMMAIGHVLQWLVWPW